MSEKKFPILGTNESIDWNLIAPHEKQAMENHGQTLEKLARRHGLSWYELLCVMADKKLLVDIEYDKEKDYEKLCRQVLLLEEVKQYRAIGTPEECRAAMEKQNVNRELESHDEKHILECCISLMQEVVNEFAEWYRWKHGEGAIDELDEEERFCFRKSYFCIVKKLFLLVTNHSGGTSTRAKCEQLGVDSAEEIEFDWSDEE